MHVLKQNKEQLVLALRHQELKQVFKLVAVLVALSVFIYILFVINEGIFQVNIISWVFLLFGVFVSVIAPVKECVFDKKKNELQITTRYLMGLLPPLTEKYALTIVQAVILKTRPPTIWPLELNLNTGKKVKLLNALTSDLGNKSATAEYISQFLNIPLYIKIYDETIVKN